MNVMKMKLTPRRRSTRALRGIATNAGTTKATAMRAGNSVVPDLASIAPA